MLVNRVQQNYYYSINSKGGFSKVSYPLDISPKSKGDVFLRSNSIDDVSFEGVAFVEKIFCDYLKQKSYKTSIKGSKRPYLSIDKDLEPFINPVKIPVTKDERINAWDINPKNSKDYVIFLHGFSQNITNNQPLYKELAKTRFGILAIDYRGYGKNPRSIHVKEDDMVQDVNASIKYLKDKGIENIGLIGHSFGAYLGAKVSSQIQPAFLVMVSPISSLEFWLRNVLLHPKKYKLEMNLIKYIKDFKEQYSKVFKISDYLKNNKTDMYVLQTSNDKYVKTTSVDDVVNNIENLKQYIKIKLGGHRMDDNKISAIKTILEGL